MADDKKMIANLQNLINEARNRGSRTTTIFISTLSECIKLLKEQKEQLDTQKENFAHLAVKLATQPQIIQCKDCKHYDKDPYCKGFGDCAGACDNLVKVHDDWFCADGERKEE